MADGTLTITIDTASSPWVYSDGTSTTVSGVAQTFTLYLYDLGSTANYVGSGAASTQDILLADGNTLQLSSDKRFVHIGDALADATAKANPGSLWVSVNGEAEEEVKIVSITVSDADCSGGGGTVANGLTTITFEYPGKPYRWNWTNEKMVLA